VNTRSYNTVSANNKTVTHDWYVLDADGKTVGRICTHIAAMLRGKNKPYFTPHTDCGDYIIVVNCEKVRFTGDKWNQKEYLDYSGYPGGQRVTPALTMLNSHPDRIIKRAVKGMLPKTKLGRAMIKKLHIFKGPDHTFQAQKPKTLSL